MTKINVVPVNMLTNEHIKNEYRYLPQIIERVLKLQKEGVIISALGIPPQYVVGEGHIKFFYTRMKWVFTRYQDLFYEMGDRNFQPDVDLFDWVMAQRNFIDSCWMGSYNPKPEDYYLNFTYLIKQSGIALVDQQLKAMNDAYMYAIAKGKA